MRRHRSEVAAAHARARGLWLLLAAGLAGGVLTSAGACRPAPAASAGADFTARPDARRFDLTGRVVSVEKDRRQATLAHERVEGFMDAMTMPFTVKERWALEAMAPGDLVQATLVVDGARSWIEVRAVTRDPRGAPSAGGEAGTWVPAEPGTPLPAVTLVDQQGREFVPADRFRGAPVVVSFTYTRCPLPEYCPLIMGRMAALEKATADRPALRRARLLSVTLDPAFDTPEVLAAYGRTYATGTREGGPFARWTLATGEPDAVQQLAAFLGLDYYTESNGLVVHSLRTAVLDGRGRLVRVFEHSGWTTEDLIGELEQLADSE